MHDIQSSFTTKLSSVLLPYTAWQKLWSNG